jgi:hypothetical protein
MGTFLARRQHNSPILYIGVQGITWTNIESAAKRPWKNDLSLGRYFGLHGKTILPRQNIDSYGVTLKATPKPFAPPGYPLIVQPPVPSLKHSSSLSSNFSVPQLPWRR